ncbi:substrate-binding domain-containing protein [Variovorax paradoxus]|uniref:substrate-binding domain-containing protein n=1 Tax=Variovorax paradoxus TaxID=34073 RepID=UPI0021ABD274|nr:substrate-binding domain-containing protein [Variovorax paradoxus]UVH57830.1 substrate-binding domain-containing protein [Variovorax paradoxus]
MRAMFKPVAMATVMVAGLLAAGAASAQIAVGGGATLPEVLYDQILPSGVGNLNYSYTGTGSGGGKTAFINNNATAFKNESVTGTPAWGASQSVHFAGSDSALSTTELANYNSAHLSAWGRLIQIPFAGTAVLVPFKRTGVTALNLTNAQMCAIYGNKTGGQTWGQVLGTSDTTPVSVAYRGESSGTTELLARYLVAACNPSGSNFAVSSTFTAVVAGEVGTIPANWQSVTGSSGMAAAMAVDGRIGYLSPDSVYNPGATTLISKINGFLPVDTSIRAALATQALPTAGTTAANNPLSWVPPYVLSSTQYPIFGTTNLIVNQCYKDPVITQRIKDVVTNLTGTAYDAAITAHQMVNLPAPLPLPNPGGNNWKQKIVDSFLTSTSSLAIGNPNVCNTVGRPLTN